MTTLEDLRIIDLSTTVAGAYCTKLFADRGADVIVIEPPNGGPLRTDDTLGPVIGTSKRSITLDLHCETGRRLFRKMVEQANVVVETFAPGELDALGLSFSRLGGIKRRIILTSITSQGQSGGNGSPDLDAQLLAGLNAFTAAAMAAHNADAYEVPQHIDISVAECLAVAVSTSPGGVPALTPDSPLFGMSEVEHRAEPAPMLGEHNSEFLGKELGLEPRDLAHLRAAGVI